MFSGAARNLVRTLQAQLAEAAAALERERTANKAATQQLDRQLSAERAAVETARAASKAHEDAALALAGERDAARRQAQEAVAAGGPLAPRNLVAMAVVCVVAAIAGRLL